MCFTPSHLSTSRLLKYVGTLEEAMLTPVPNSLYHLLPRGHNFYPGNQGGHH